MYPSMLFSESVFELNFGGKNLEKLYIYKSQTLISTLEIFVKNLNIKIFFLKYMKKCAY